MREDGGNQGGDWGEELGKGREIFDESVEEFLMGRGQVLSNLGGEELGTFGSKPMEFFATGGQA